MSIVKNYKRKCRYSTIDNTGVLDESLSWKAKGLLWYILSKPDDWQVKMADLIKRSKDGRDATRSAFAELEAHRYAIQTRGHDEKGLFCWNTVVFDCPEAFDEWAETDEGRSTLEAKKTTKPQPVSGETSDGKSVNGQSNDGQPEVIYITDSTNIESTNIEEEKDADDFFVKSPLTQNQENSFPVKTTPRIQETPTPPTPASPLPSEKQPKKVYPDPMGDRFKLGKKANRYQTLISTNPEWGFLEDWGGWEGKLVFKESLIKAQQAFLKGNSGNLPHERDNAISSLAGYIFNKKLDFFEQRIEQALKIEAAEAIATQQQQVEQQRFQQPDDTAPTMTPEQRKQFAADLKRRQALKKLAA